MDRINSKKQKGFVLLFAVTLASIILAIALGIANISLKEAKFATSARDSNVAFFSADTGIDCALLYDKSSSRIFFNTPSATTIDCAGGTRTVTGGNGVWTFKVLGLGTSGLGCAIVTVNKSGTYPIVNTLVVSKGYNLGGDGTCASTSSTLIERELDVRYGPPAEMVWFDDALPAGAAPNVTSDSWSWVASSPGPYAGALSHQSDIFSGKHQHYFSGATATLTVNTGESLFTYVYLDPANPPTEVMLQWNNGGWDHRAYWGATSTDFINYGPANYIGTLPATGQWVKISVPASVVGLEGSILNGMAFTLFDGRATWDYAGKE
jgi:hypothetical protein